MIMVIWVPHFESLCTIISDLMEQVGMLHGHGDAFAPMNADVAFLPALRSELVVNCQSTSLIPQLI